jgi:hypothetical protein
VLHRSDRWGAPVWPVSPVKTSAWLVWPVITTGLTGGALSAQVFGEKKFNLVVAPIHPPLGDIKVLSQARRRPPHDFPRWSAVGARPPSSSPAASRFTAVERRWSKSWPPGASPRRDKFVLPLTVTGDALDRRRRVMAEPAVRAPPSAISPSSSVQGKGFFEFLFDPSPFPPTHPVPSSSRSPAPPPPHTAAPVCLRPKVGEGAFAHDPLWILVIYWSVSCDLVNLQETPWIY